MGTTAEKGFDIGGGSDHYVGNVLLPVKKL